VPTTEATCIDCDHAFELPEDDSIVLCHAHMEYRAAEHPASCAEFAPRQPLTAVLPADDSPADRT